MPMTRPMRVEPRGLEPLTPCLQSEGMAIAQCRWGALSVAEPRRTALSSGDIAVLCCCTCCLAAALSGIWMTLTYPLPAHGGPLLNTFRLVFGTMMVVSIVLAFLAIRRHDVATHRAWMMRGYAIGQGAGTQAVLLGFGSAVFGAPGLLTYALVMGAAWVLNLAVAEVGIRRRTVRTPPRVPVAAR